MITVHHLNNSRSQRVLWLLEELGEPDYEVIRYYRDPQTKRAPPELKRIHPLGKSPVIEDNGRIIAESGAVIEYILRHYGHGRFMPDDGSTAYFDYLHWTHFAEGSAMFPLLMQLYMNRLGTPGAPLLPRITSEVASHLGYLERELGDRTYFMGPDLMAADIQLWFIVEIAQALGLLGPYAKLRAYLDRIHARPAYQRAIERGGPFALLT